MRRGRGASRGGRIFIRSEYWSYADDGAQCARLSGAKRHSIHSLFTSSRSPPRHYSRAINYRATHSSFNNNNNSFTARRSMHINNTLSTTPTALLYKRNTLQVTRRSIFSGTITVTSPPHNTHGLISRTLYKTVIISARTHEMRANETSKAHCLFLSVVSVRERAVPSYHSNSGDAVGVEARRRSPQGNHLQCHLLQRRIVCVHVQ